MLLLLVVIFTDQSPNYAGRNTKQPHAQTEVQPEEEIEPKDISRDVILSLWACTLLFFCKSAIGS